jgi:hypothetical protein
MFGKDLIDQGLVKDIKQLEWFIYWLCVCSLLMMLLIECMGCAGCTLQKTAEGDILRSHTQIFIRQNSAERAHTKTHLQTVIWFCV